MIDEYLHIKDLKKKKKKLPETLMASMLHTNLHVHESDMISDASGSACRLGCLDSISVSGSRVSRRLPLATANSLCTMTDSGCVVHDNQNKIQIFS